MVKLAGLDSFILRGMADWELPGLSIAIVKDGRVILEKGYGLRDLNSPLPVDAHTVFGICSTTKAMTAVTLAMLVDEGKLAWDSPVMQYLPEFQLRTEAWTKKVRVRDLLTHNAGLPNLDFLWYANTLDTREMVRRLRYAEEAYPIRGGYTYQNVMYAVAGLLVERVSGKTWTAFVKERLLDPLGMSETSATWEASLSRENRMSPHFIIGEKVTRIPYPRIDQIAPAGSVWSSAHDMTKWMLFLLEGGRVGDKALLSAENFRELFKPQALVPIKDFYPTAALTQPTWTTYGLGWFQQDYRGHTLHFHTGSIDGNIAILGLLPAERLGVFVLGNLDHAELRHAVLFQVLDLFGMRKIPTRDWHADVLKLYRQLEDKSRSEPKPQVRLDGRQLDRYCGIYEDPLNGRVEVTRFREGGLAIQLSNQLTMQVHPVGENTFEGEYADYPWFGTRQVGFRRRAASGRVISLSLGPQIWRRKIVL